jgi:drug/metabolite transporter (DMT)-like permease
MTPRQAASLVVLAAIWGSSFLFIRIAVDELGPAVLTEARVLLAAVPVAAFVLLGGGRLALRERWRDFLLLGTFAAALPFGLIAVAELELPASLASILNSTPPIWSAVIAALFFGERFTPRLAAGLGLALGGVALVVGLAPVDVDLPFVLAALAMLVSGVLYGAMGLFSARRMKGVAPLRLVVGQHAAAAVVLLPAVALFPVREAPDVGEWGAVLALGLLCTALAFVLYFRLIAAVGATRTLTVTFLVPVFGVFWGAVFLGEELRPAQGLGALVLLAGVWLVVRR